MIPWCVNVIIRLCLGPQTSHCLATWRFSSHDGNGKDATGGAARNITLASYALAKSGV